MFFLILILMLKGIVVVIRVIFWDGLGIIREGG